MRFPLHLLPLIATLVLPAGPAGAAPSAAAPAPRWPDTDLSRHVQAYFAQLPGSVEDARRFFTEHMAASALAEAGVEARLQRRSGMLERTRGLAALEVLEATPSSMSVRCRAGNGDDVVAYFAAEAGPPHRLLGVRLEAGSHPGGFAPPAGPPLDDAEAVERIRAHLDARAASRAFSGTALLARGDSILLAGAWGLADRAKGTPATLATRFNLASIGKVLTRVAVAQLCEQGRLSLDDRLSAFVPGFPNADSITVDMLCEHRSGIGDIFNDQYRAMDHARLRHNRDYLELLRDQPLWFPPGTGERYSNGGYVLLGEVIASASGEDYYDYLAKHVLAPAGMSATGWPVEGDGTAGLARGYTREGAKDGAETDNVATRPARGSAAGGGCASAPDLLALDRALFGGRLCSAGWAAWVAGGPRPGPGTGAPEGAPAFGVSGGAPGASTHWLHEGDLTLVVLTNRDPEVTGEVLGPVRDAFRRMRPTRLP